MRLSDEPFFKWARVIVVLWMGGMVGSLYFLEKAETSLPDRRHAEEHSEHNVTCGVNVTFKGTLGENLQKLRNNTFSKALPWIQYLDSIRTRPRALTSFPVLVTAANQNYFVRSQGLVKSIIDRLLPAYKGLKLIYFDLGLTVEQRNILKRNCKCEIRQLPFKNLPKHVRDLTTYAFKPVIVYLMYKEFGRVWWLDASARFVSSDLDLPFKYQKETGIMFFTFDQSANIALHTDRRMFKYFNEDPCLYKNFGEIDASHVAFRKSRTNDVILSQWLACALDENCIAPPEVSKYCVNDDKVTKWSNLVGQCHRFDQSALSIILRRLYHKQNHYPLVETPFKIIDVRRKENIRYFM